MKFDSKYHQGNKFNLNNKLRKIGRKYFSPKVPVLEQIIFEMKHTSKVLDIGAGVGGLLQMIETKNKKLKTYALDLICPIDFYSTASRICGNAYQIPLANNSFDLVVCSHVFEHLHEPYKALSEIKRVTKSQGHIYIETPSQRSLLLPFGPSFWDDPTHIRPYTKNAFKRLFYEHDLEIVSIGTKKSIAGIILGLPYLVIGSFTKDPQAMKIFPTYLFGLNIYVIGKKN